MRTIWIAVLALGSLVAASYLAAAQEKSPTAARDTGITMTLGGTGTAAEAAAADDTELTYWLRRRIAYNRAAYWGGYSSYYGGGWGGYSSYYGGGWGGSYVSYYAPVRPVYYSPVVYRPYVFRPFVYRPAFYRPYVFPRAIPYVSFARGNYWRIDATAEDLNSPAITLGSNAATSYPVVFPVESIVEEGTFRYDGGPANPVPLPKPDATPRSGDATGLPVSLQKAKPASPYSYKAYGER